MNKTMIIVESKAKTLSIGKIVGNDYVVQSCLGHVYDLPENMLGINIKNDFKPTYILIKGKGSVVKSLKTESQHVSTVILATDPDREGESIAWHLSNLFKDKKTYRIKFNEITKKAIIESLAHLEEIDMNLVYAQQARRLVDRLVGYKISPLLWKNLKKGLSAGRVQSVALKLICEREKEIENFVPEEYWNIVGLFCKYNKKQCFHAKFLGTLNEEIKIKSEEQSKALVKNILSNENYNVRDIVTKEEKKKPPPPYITSTLQQDGVRKFGISTGKIMSIAQQLYEGLPIMDEGTVGLITYMRTDSPRISTESQEEAKKYILEKYGKKYLPDMPYKYKLKGNVQDAHEAIRPTSVFREPALLKNFLNKDQFRLYELIWKRFLASQSAAAVMSVTKIDITNEEFLFRATGSTVAFDGFLKIFIEQEDKKENEEDKIEETFPELSAGEKLSLKEIQPFQHFTKAPPRYNEASLIKTLEEKGIGRPSTYVPIIETITRREYVTLNKRTFYPTKWGIIVNGLMQEHFPDIMDYKFTANIENDLDKVETGEASWLDVVKNFYAGFSVALEKASNGMLLPEAEQIDEDCEKCGAKMVMKKGRFGLFLGCSRYPDCNNTKPFVPKGAENSASNYNSQPPVVTDQKCEKCGKELLIRTGKRGQFLACSGFPKCKNTRPYIRDISCPEKGCNGKITKKLSKKRKGFYGCTNYPNCTFVSWAAPDAEDCPKCNAFLINKNIKGLPVKSCIKCDYVKETTATNIPAQETTQTTQTVQTAH